MTLTFKRNYCDAAGKILKEFITAHGGENIVFSPYSILLLVRKH